MEKPTGFIQKIIESLQQINALDAYSPIEKDIILHNLRAAYMTFLNVSIDEQSIEDRVEKLAFDKEECRIQDAECRTKTETMVEEMIVEEMEDDEIEDVIEETTPEVAEIKEIEKGEEIEEIQEIEEIEKIDEIIEDIEKVIENEEIEAIKEQPKVDENEEYSHFSVSIGTPDEVVDDYKEELPEATVVDDYREELPEATMVDDYREELPEATVVDDYREELPEATMVDDYREELPEALLVDDILEFIPSAKPHAGLLFDDTTLPKSEKKSLNDLLNEKREDQSLGTRFQQSFIPDLTKAIAINEKFTFIRELFRNSGVDFSNAIQKLNECENIDTAFNLMEDLKHQYFWDTTSTSYLALCDLVRRRFL